MLSFIVLCPADWYLFNGHCYYSSVDSSSTFDVATASCQEVNTNAQLASIHDAIEDEKLSISQSSNAAFIGLKKFAEDIWQWNDGTKADFTNWDEGQPGDGECAVIKKNGKNHYFC